MWVKSFADCTRRSRKIHNNKDVFTFSKPQHDKELNQYDKIKDTFTDKQGNTHSVKDFSNHLHTQAKEQENNFKGFLQGLKTENNAIIDTHITKSIESIESKIRRKSGNTDGHCRLLKG